jgi:CHAT domain-containing protein
VLEVPLDSGRSTDACALAAHVSAVPFRSTALAAWIALLVCSAGCGAPGPTDQPSSSRGIGGISPASAGRAGLIREGEAAVLERPNDPDALIELASALLMETVGERQPEDHVRALDLAVRASELAPRNLRACELQTVALERLRLRVAASEKEDPCSALPGSDDTGAPLRTLRTDGERSDDGFDRDDLVAALSSGDALSVVERHPRTTRELVEEELLPDWADRVAADGPVAAAERLETLRRLSRLLASATGDRLTIDSADAVEAAVARGGERLDDLVAGHRLYRDALGPAQRNDCAVARPLLERSARLLERAGSPFKAWPEFRVAVCAYLGDRYDDAERRLEALRSDLSGSSYAALLGNIGWMEGLIEGRRLSYGLALMHYDAALKRFESMGDDVGVAAVNRLLAEMFDFLGQYREGWRRRGAALTTLNRIDRPRTRQQILFSTAAAAFHQGYPRAAASIARLGTASARSRADATELAAASVRLAAYLGSAGRSVEAGVALDEARASLPRVPPPSDAELAAEIEAAQGRLLLSTDPDRALLALDRAIDFFSHGAVVRLPELYSLRGRARLRLGRPDAAEADLLAGLELLDASRDTVFEMSDRIAYADVVRGAYDEMIGFQIEARNRPDVALEYAERGRARLLRERALARGRGAVPSAEPVGAGSIRSLARYGAGLIYYAVLDDRVLVWAAADDERDHAEIAIDRRWLADRISALRFAAERTQDDARVREISHGLYDVLIRPVVATIRDRTHWILFPDKELHLVPFALLADRDTDRYLIQDHYLAIAPSATLLVAVAGRQTLAQDETPSALVVGNPSVDRSLFRDLPDLPGAEAEAAALHEIYPSGRLLVGGQATKERFLNELGRYEVVHFAGHALPDPVAPLRSRLLLTPDPVDGDTGELRAETLYRSDFDDTRVVVLAACDTGSGRVSTAEGAISLARPFLAAGVSAVVATLWRIDDVASSELFVRFHREYRKGRDPVTALRAAQLALIEDGRPAIHRPGVWAASQVYLGATLRTKGGTY